MDNIPINQYTIECTQYVFDEMLQVMIDLVYKQEPISTLSYDKQYLFDALTALENVSIKGEYSLD